MSSSMLTGERRWASARRGGMTVLGKVAVPKPINLPSQRLENHGLNPNVEIVPKGTHSWGSRSSSSTSTAWGSSTLSPNTDGDTGSPSLSGRPSSGGTGTRPSTAGSDRAHEPIINAGGSNSRPSSASGALASSQTSHVSLRPQSAETRPGSSQLSRFAEPLSDNSGAWGASGTAEKLGVASSKNDGFSLASGDFPTLGAGKETSVKNMDSQDHGSHSLPGSSGGVIPGKESTGNSIGDVSANAKMKSGAANSWRRENLPYGDGGASPGVEKWHADPQLYPSSNIPPQHYDAWHGPPVNNHPGGVWYRGLPGGPPFRSPVPSGGFPMEPFPYYHPQIPPTALANPPPVLPPGAGPRGPHPHPKNGDMYRPHMHEAYICPGMPLRPGFYPGPVPYEGYYGPPRSYCNSSERDIPFMGMAVRPAPYDRYASQNTPDGSSCHGISSGRGPNAKTMVLEQVESGQPQDAQGPYKVLLKQHDGWEGRGEELKGGDTATTNASYSGKGGHPKSLWENDWREENKKDKDVNSRRMGLHEEGSSVGVDNRGFFPVKVKSPESVGNLKASDGSSVKKLEYADPLAPIFPEASTASKDPSLIQKIEGLNAKARACDGRQDVKSSPSREENKNKFNAGNPKSNHSVNAAGTGAASVERIHDSNILYPHKDHISAVDKNLDSTGASGIAATRRPMYAMHGRADNRGKRRFSTQDADGWQKGSQAEELSGEEASLFSGSSSVVTSREVTEKSMPCPQGNDDREESMPPNSERAKIKELAKQRLKQREMEEEERIRDQKAKALAKLEELDRRTQAGEGLTQHMHEELLALVQPAGAASKSRGKNSALGANVNAVAESSISQVEKPASWSSEVLQQAPKTAHKESVVMHDQSEPLQHDVRKVNAPHHNNALPIHDTGTSRQKRMGYRQKHNTPLEKNSSEKLISSSTSDASNSAVTSDVAAGATVFQEGVSNEIASKSDSNLIVSQSAIAESSVPQRKKSRSARNKHKVEESSSALALLPMGSKDPTALDAVVESSKAKIAEPALDPASVKDSKQSMEQPSSTPSEEAHSRISNQWKSQHARRIPKNPQANKSTEKFHSSDAVVWAPVRSQNKIEVTDEASEKTVVEVVVPSTRSDQQVQNYPRNKRAEMERYVSKAVGKEMAQQGTSHHSVAPLMSQIVSGESAGRPEFSSLGAESSQTSETGIGKVGSAAESTNGNGRQNKLGKGHGSWRQRGSSESTFASNPDRHFQKSIEQRQPPKLDASTVKEQSSCPDEWSMSDGWNNPEKTDAPVNDSVVKDHGVTAKAKQQPLKGHKGAGHNHDADEKNINIRDPVHSSSLEMCQTDFPATSKENQAVSERSTTHWQPKSQPFPGSNQRGSRTNGGQNTVAEICKSNKMDSSSQGQPEEETAVFRDQHPHDPFSSEKGNFEEAPGVRHPEAKRERRMTSQKGRPGSPMEPSSSNTEVQNEQRPSSGFRKNGSQNSRFGREHEFYGNWSGPGKDSRQHNVPANRERQRQSSHYEYQAVGAVPHNKANNFESLKEGSHNSSSRYKERGQGQSRRGGNFYRRQSGTMRVDASCD